MVQNAMVETTSNPYTLLLGVAQDGGYPQAGCRAACCAPAWANSDRRGRVVSLGIADPLSGERWLIDASPDLPVQLHALDASLGPDISLPALSGVLLTHGHIGHYTGLMYLGRESMGTRISQCTACLACVDSYKTTDPGSNSVVCRIFPSTACEWSDDSPQLNSSSTFSRAPSWGIHRNRGNGGFRS